MKDDEPISEARVREIVREELAAAFARLPTMNAPYWPSAECHCLDADELQTLEVRAPNGHHLDCPNAKE